VSPAPRTPALAPFRVRAFRFQWPADLATSWAFEMETLILGWYVLVETGSVMLLTVFASLQHIGTLIAPMFGVAGDRLGHRTLLAAMRGVYTLLAATLMTLAYLELLTPAYVLAVAAVAGLVRPSDIGMRAALVAETMPPPQLVGAMGIQRTTQDTARIAGALSGAGIVAALGIGAAYTVVAALYALSVALTWQAGSGARSAARAEETGAAPAAGSPWRDLRAGLAYVWATPHLLGMMGLAFLINLTAFPLYNGLLPYVVREVYGSDQTTLGYMVAGASCGALLGSVVMSRYAASVRPARAALAACACWYVALFLFSRMTHPGSGLPLLMLAGFALSMGQVPMAAMLLRTSDPLLRGRVMGIRMLMIYSNVPGLLAAGWLVARHGYAATAALYCAVGIAFTLLIALRWRGELWRRDAPANRR
jgi:Na+/melibiose symporter-like transporter